MLLSAALERIAGEPLHLYLTRTLFRPLNINSAKWHTDKRGRCPFYYGLTINATDLAKIGTLILKDGQNLLTPDWIQLSTATPSLKANERIGLLWFFQPSATANQKPVMIQHSAKPDKLPSFPNLIADNFLRQ